jgi:hypothetical protein
MNPKQTFFQKLLGVKVAQAPTVQDVRPVIDPAKVREAIAYNETRGVQGDPYLYKRYSGMKNLGDAIGRYQVTEGEIKTYAPKYLGKPVDINEFRKSKSAQDQYMDAKISYYSNKGYTPQQIADIHRAGYKNSSAPGADIYQNKPYVDSFSSVYNTTN